jgi:hypothetical protein
MTFGCKRAAVALALVMGSAGAAQADRIKNPTAVFSGLDKITGRIVSFEAAVDETVQFGSLQMTANVCYTKPPTENPNTTSFVEVDDVGLDGLPKRVFSGWMFASSPGLHGMEHPVYDIWLVDCKGGTEVVPEPKEVVETPPPIQQDPVARQAPAQPGSIIAPTAGNLPAAAAPPAPVAPVAPAPVEPVPQRPVRRIVPAAPVINNERTNDR